MSIDDTGPEDLIPDDLIPWDKLMPGSDKDPEALGEAMTADSPEEAQVVAALLRAAGIPLYMDGRLLQDEFAISQAITGGVGRQIMVPASRVEEAQAVIAQARKEGESMEDPRD
ncbi:MAG: putative signal transducing protein [Planctomycetota bacterium]|jgi:hypothetical protein